MWTSLSLIIAFFCTYKPYIVNLYIKLFPLTCNLLCNICIFLLTFIIIITIIEMNECIFFVLCCKCSSIHMFVWLVVKSCNVMYWLSVIMYQFLYIYTQFTYKNCAFLFGISKRHMQFIRHILNSCIHSQFHSDIQKKNVISTKQTIEGCCIWSMTWHFMSYTCVRKVSFFFY